MRKESEAAMGPAGVAKGSGSGFAMGAIILALVVVRAVWLATLLAHLPEDVGGHYVASDALRYTDIAFEPGRPYRDRAVEIPPVEVLELEALADPDPHATTVRLAWLQFVLDVAIAAGVIVGWGTAAGIGYLLIGLPLAPFLAFRLDLLSVALAVWGLAVIRHRRDRLGGVLLAVAVLAKMWPAVLIVPLVAAKRWRALVWGASALAIGVVAWVAYGGVDGPMQVATLREATGWQIESVFGSLLLVSTTMPVIYEQGANRIGEMVLWLRVSFQLVLVAALAGAAVLARRVLNAARGEDPSGEVMALSSLAAVSALLATAPILSWQYIAWLVPWIGIIAARRRWLLTVIGILVVGFTASLLFQGVPLTERSGFAVGLVLARDAALIALAVGSLVALARDGRQKPAPVGSARAGGTLEE